MDERAVWSTFDARPGRERDAEAFLEECCRALEQEPGTTGFFALTLGPGRYATFATMADDAALDAHVQGPVAEAVRTRGAELFTPPAVVVSQVIGCKTPATPDARR